MDDQLNICDECSSDYLAASSKMDNLCPECSYHLYGYENCPHIIEGKRCKICYWDGSHSKYILSLIQNNAERSDGWMSLYLISDKDEVPEYPEKIELRSIG